MTIDNYPLSSILVLLMNTHDHTNDWWNTFWQDPKKNFGAPRQELVQKVLDFRLELNLDRPVTLLDIGSGNGRYSLPFAKLGFLTSVIEKSSTACEIIRTRSSLERARVEIINSDLFEQLDSLKSKQYDVVFSSGLLEEIDQKDQGTAVEKIQGLTKDGGLMILKYCLEIDGRGKTVEEDFIPSYFINNQTWKLLELITDKSMRDSIATIDFENSIRTETIIAIKSGVLT